MLSGPPAWWAESTIAAIASSSSTSANSSASTSSSTKPQSPSLQNNSRSPVCSSSSVRSASLAGCPFSTLSNSERCGWTAASSSLILPSSISDCTHEWSWVSRSNRPSRKR